MKPDFEILFEEPLNADGTWDADPMPEGWQYQGETATDESRCGVDYARTYTITADNASGTFTPTGPRHEFGEENAATLQEAIDAGGSLADVHEQLYGGDH